MGLGGLGVSNKVLWDLGLGHLGAKRVLGCCGVGIWGQLGHWGLVGWGSWVSYCSTADGGIWGDTGVWGQSDSRVLGEDWGPGAIRGAARWGLGIN